LLLTLSGCAQEATPVLPTPIVLDTPAPTSPPPTAVPSATPTAQPQLSTPTAAGPTLAAQVAQPGVPTPVPIMYQMFDFGTDFQHERPELGPVGSIHWSLWRNINPGPGQYNWKPIDDKLASESQLKVTLADGTEIPKPVVLQIMAYISSAPGWNADFYDGTPQWVYDQIDRQKPNDLRPVVQGMKVGHALKGCGKTAVVPMFDSYAWQKAYLDMIAAFGARYNDNPQVTAVVICTGLDGETQVMKDWSCQWNAILDAQAPDTRYNFGKVWKESMRAYREAFPDKTLYINNAPGGSGMRKATSDYAATFDPPIGLKHSGLWVDLDSHKGYGNFYGSWDMINAYSQTLPIWLESVFGMGSAEHRYWTYFAGLHYHPDAIDCHPEFLEQSDPAWLKFVVAHLGVDINNTPDVWTVLRDSEFPLNDWGSGGTSGHPGDWTFWLTRSESAPQSATERVWREDMPAAKDAVQSRQTRRTKQAEDQLYMSFDIDDAYPYVNQRPAAAEGNVYYVVHVTLLNMGHDTFALQYRNWNGDLVSQTRRKGPSLGKVDDWVTVSFVVEDAYLNNNMPGNTDFRISCERDGDEYIHMVRVEGGWGPAPSPTATSPPTATVTPSNTPSPTPTGPTPTSSSTSTPRPTSPPGTLAPTLTPLARAIQFLPAADTYIDAWAPQQNWSAEQSLALRQGNAQAPLLRFDLTTIPPTSRVDRAVLQVCVTGRTNAGSLTMIARRVLSPWVADQVTWTNRSTRDRWTVAGCQDPVRDRSDIILGSATLSEINYWYELDLTEVAQAWVSQPAANYGLILQSSGSASVQYDLYASEHPFTGQRPQLWVSWAEVSPTPTRVETPTRTPTPGPSPTPSPTRDLSPTPSPTPKLVVLRRGGAGDAAARDVVVDTFLDQLAETVPQEGRLNLSARQGGTRLPLMYFDLATVPARSAIKRGTLFLYTSYRSNPAPLTLSVMRLKRPWSRDKATWLQATALDMWAQMGASDPDLDRGVEVYARQVLQEASGWSAFDITDLVQAWNIRPVSNFGLLLAADGPVPVEYSLASSEWSVAFQPYLEVEYIPVAPSPTPSLTPTATPTLFVPTATWTPFPTVGLHEFQQGTDGYDHFADTYLDQWNPQRANELAAELIVRAGAARTTLLQARLDALPAESCVNQALLGLYIGSRSSDAPLSLAAYEVLHAWDPAQATYERASLGDPWCADGAALADCDIARDPAARVSAGGAEQWLVLDITALVEKWVQHPEANHGLLLRATGAEAVEYALASSEWLQDTARRPRLYVDWEPLVPTPTPLGTPSPLVPSPTASATATATPLPTPAPTPTPHRLARTYQQGLQGYTGAADTYLDQWNQQLNWGQVDKLKIRQKGVYTALLRFALDPMPAGADLRRATLRLWVAGRSNTASMPISVHLLRQPWSASEANYTERAVGVPWESAGAAGAPGDHEAESVAASTLSGTSQWLELDVTRAVAQWLDAPDENHGLVLLSGGSVSVEYVLTSSDAQQPDYRPQLVLSYDLPPDVAAAEEPRSQPNLLRGVALALSLVVLLLTLAAIRQRRKGQEAQGEHLVR
jgi:hypothetical protein